MTISVYSWGWRLGIASWLVMAGAIATSLNCVRAQVTPDSTLGAESSVVTPATNIDGLPTEQIDGGATRGANLFHSFEQFSIPTGGAAYFNNALDVQNIISRVTGKSISNIDGLIRANGTANLFLINPNGIIFGPNASLNIGGSFLGSTASSLNFADGTFSATAPQTAPLLSVSVPIGLQYGGPAGNILSQSQATGSSGEPVGIQVQSGRTLALVGGNVNLDGSRLLALGGRVELGGVAGAGTVGLFVDSNNLLVSFPDNVARADVYLTALGSDTAMITVAGGNGGSIAITARNIDVSGGSVVRGGIETGLGFPDAQAGNITLHATGEIAIANSNIFNNVRTGAVGNGGNININARSLSISDGAQLSASTLGRGNSGSIFLQTDNSVSLASSAVFSQVQAGGVGNGGDINITAGSLSLTDGTQLQTLVSSYDNKNKLPAGRGNAGDVNINVRDTVTLVGKGRDSGTAITAIWTGVGFGAVGNGGDINIIAKALSLTNAPLGADTNGQGNAGNVFVRVVDSIYLTNSDFVLEGSRRSRIGSDVGFRAVGDGGNIDIQSRSLFLNNGAVLDASTQGKGNGGNIMVSADTFAATNGGQIFATTRSSGRAGSISLNVTDSVTLSGSDPKFAERRVRSDSNTIIPDSPASGLFARTEGAGVAGDLQITTGQLQVLDGAEVTVSGESGFAGSLTATANSILLDQGKLTAVTGAGSGGNIRLQMQDLLLMRDHSLISAEALSTANGGNINIDTDFIIAVPSENSDIIADASKGNGGNIDITTQGIFGTQFREEETSQSDITASSDFGVDGVVEINTPDVDPSRGLITLPAELVDASGLIAQGCGAGGTQGQSEFIVTGRGGLPPNPSDTINSDAVWIDLDSTTQLAENRPNSIEATQPTNSMPEQLVEATGWAINDKGQVVLTASVPTATPYRELTTAQCHIP